MNAHAAVGTCNPTWSALMRYTLPRLKSLACQSFWDGMGELSYNHQESPDLERLRDFIFKRTGWTLQRAQGEVPASEFLGMLGRKEFPLVFELRPLNQTFASSNPDLWHEVIGHVPLLLDPRVRELYLAIGQSAQVSGDDFDTIAALIRLYWFFGEYGLIEEEGQTKIFGAGLLASPLGADCILHKHVKIKKMTAGRILKAHYNPYSFQKDLFVFSSFNAVLSTVANIRQDLW